MNLVKYITDSQQISEVAGSEKIRASRGILSATEIKRDELRESVERHPKRNEADLTEDLYFRLGMIYMANWVLSLPQEARTFLEKTPLVPVIE